MNANFSALVWDIFLIELKEYAKYCVRYFNSFSRVSDISKCFIILKDCEVILRLVKIGKIFYTVKFS